MTYNLRAYFDRWYERGPEIVKALKEVQPDVLACQEMMVNGGGMDTYISTSLTTSSTPYTPYSDPSIITSLFTFGSSHTEYGYVVATVFVGVLRVLHLILSLPIVRVVVGAMPLYLEATREYLGSKTGVDILDLYYVTLGAFFGISTIVNEGRFQACGWETLVLQPDENVVGGVRKHLGTVSRVCMREGGRKLFWVVNIHYTHFATEDGRRMREQECRRVVEWMKGVEDETEGRVVVLGDHNTLMKKEGIFGIMKKEGYKSAHKEANGREPRCTWPSGLKAIYMDKDGMDLPQVKAGICLDYIWVKGEGVEVVRAGVKGDECMKGDKTLYPSDHVGVWADVIVK